MAIHIDSRLLVLTDMSGRYYVIINQVLKLRYSSNLDLKLKPPKYE